MAEKKLSKNSEEWAMFHDYWRLVQKFYEPEPQGSPYWTALVDEIGAFAERYKSKFAEGLAFEYVQMIERRYKEMFG